MIIILKVAKVIKWGGSFLNIEPKFFMRGAGREVQSAGSDLIRFAIPSSGCGLSSWLWTEDQVSGSTNPAPVVPMFL
jgi:hypothetical protein